jgi:osmotically-inducible protein OsmY
MRLRSMFFGAAVGAAVAYLFDPDQGRARRSRLRDRSAARARLASERLAGRSQFLADTAVGRVLDVRSRWMPRPVDDATLADRIRSEALGDRRIPSGEINVDVVAGRATLRGELADRGLIEEVVARVRAVPGVVGVENLLHTAEEPAENKRDAVRASRRASGSTPPEGTATE